MLITADTMDSASFDRCALRLGWQYDNGGRYQDKSWDWYHSATRDLGRSNSVAMLRDECGVVVLLHFRGLEPQEVWRGVVAEHTDLERGMSVLESYLIVVNAGQG